MFACSRLLIPDLRTVLQKCFIIIHDTINK